MEGAMKALKDDPEMAPIFAELESGGPAAMMKCARACAGVCCA
jgi:hypothetical protein